MLLKFFKIYPTIVGLVEISFYPWLYGIIEDNSAFVLFNSLSCSP